MTSHPDSGIITREQAIKELDTEQLAEFIAKLLKDATRRPAVATPTRIARWLTKECKDDILSDAAVASFPKHRARNLDPKTVLSLKTALEEGSRSCIRVEQKECSKSYCRTEFCYGAEAKTIVSCVSDHPGYVVLTGLELLAYTGVADSALDSILSALTAFCKENGYHELRIDGLEHPRILRWAAKHPLEHMSREYDIIDGLKTGSYCMRF